MVTVGPTEWVRYKLYDITHQARIFGQFLPNFGEIWLKIGQIWRTHSVGYPLYKKVVEIRSNGQNSTIIFEKQHTKRFVSPSCPRFLSPYKHPPFMQSNFVSPYCSFKKNMQKLLGSRNS